MPGDDEEDDEDDGFLDSDGFMDTDSEFDGMEIAYNLLFGPPQEGMSEPGIDSWEEEAITDVTMENSNWGLSDGASDSVSEVEGLAPSGELPENDRKW